MCFRGDCSQLADMEGLRDLQAGLLAAQGSEQTVKLGTGDGWLSQEPCRDSRLSRWLPSPSSPLCLGAQAHCGLHGQSILLGGGNCWPLESLVDVF